MVIKKYSNAINPVYYDFPSLNCRKKLQLACFYIWFNLWDEYVRIYICDPNLVTRLVATFSRKGIKFKIVFSEITWHSHINVIFSRNVISCISALYPTVSLLRRKKSIFIRLWCAMNNQKKLGREKRNRVYLDTRPPEDKLWIFNRPKIIAYHSKKTKQNTQKKQFTLFGAAVLYLLIKMIFIGSDIRDTRNIYNYNLLQGREL